MEEKILNILCKVNKDVCWDDYLDKIENSTKRYQQAIGNEENPEIHLTPILPEYWEVFHTHNIYRRCNGSLLCPAYDVGVFLVGFSTLPIVLSLAEIQPTQEIYFLYSEETESMLKEISNRISVMLPESSLSSLVTRSITCPDHALEIDGSSDPVQTFKWIKEVIDKVGDKPIALDLTGGKKTMLGGGFTAGSILAIEGSESLSVCGMFYVDSLEYDSRSRAPKPGTEFLSRLENPYDIYNVQSVGQAEALFYEHNYEAAVHLWREVQEKLGEHAERYGLQNEQDTVEKDLHMADCYSLWDTFDYKAADSAKQNGHLWGYSCKHVNGQIDVLNVLCAIEDQETLFDDEARVIHWAADRYQNAVRRYESDRFNDAIVRFTQVVEILCIYQIYQIQEAEELTDGSHNVITCPKVVLDEHWSVTKLIRFLFTDRPNETYEGRYRIGNFDKRLKINEYGYRNVSDITRLIKHRNIFVHVENTPAWEDLRGNAEKLRKLALKFLENFSKDYCCCKGLDFGDLLELHRFCR